MIFDDIDIKVLQENFTTETIEKLDKTNAAIIYNYLLAEGIYYAKDIFITNLDLFLLPATIFKEKFKRLEETLGNDYVNKLGDDQSLIDIMYQD
jgi:hypothetical protein